MSFGDHLEELRRRLIYAIFGIVPLFVVAFVLGRPILDTLMEPARDKLRAGGQSATLLATAPFETFGTVIQIAVIATVLVGAPWILYQLWLFVAPGLYEHERKFVHLLVPFSGLLTALSILFLYFVILPVILAFFIGFANQIAGPPVPVDDPPASIVFPQTPILDFDPVQPEVGDTWINAEINQHRFCIGFTDDGTPIIKGTELIGGAGIVQQYKVSEYVKTILNLGLAFGIGFQTPVVVVLLGWAGIVSPGLLAGYRRHAIAACAIAGAVLTPADPMSMVLLAVPLYLLFELGVFILRVFPAERVLRGAREPADAGDA